VYVLIAMALQRIRPVQLEAPAELVEAARGQLRHQPGAGPGAHRSGAEGGELVLVDAGATVEIVDPATTHLTVVAVVPRGISRRRLRALVADYLSGELLGVLLVEGRPGIRPVTPRPARATATAGARQPVLAAPTQEAT
jgi:hypothetical protein